MADRGPESLSQTDTFFRVRSGRLKLREFSDRPAELIFYHRPDTLGPAASEWTRISVPDGPALRELLTAALGVRGQVSKRRLVFWVGRTRVHLDEVQDLGAFLELEVVLEEGEPASAGAAEAHRLLALLGVPADALVAEAYIDLLEQQGGRGRRPVSPGNHRYQRTTK